MTGPIKRAAVLVLVFSLLPAPVRASVGTAAAPPPASTLAEFLEMAKGIRAAANYQPASSRDRVVARFSSAARAGQAARANGAFVARDIDGAGTVVLVASRRGGGPALRRALRDEPGFRWAEADHAVRAMGQRVPWGVEAIKAPQARSANAATGAGVVVAIVDTGVDYNHEDLDANIWSNPGETGSGRETNGIDDDGNGYVDDFRGWDFTGKLFTATEEDNDPTDEVGHGTHVAGTVAAEDNGVGVIGVAPRATIMPVRVLDDAGFGFSSHIANGIRYAADNGAHIINLSLGGYLTSAAIREAVEHAASRNVAVVAAAGNAFFYSLPLYPAGYPSVISVSAARESDHEKTWWSDWGTSDFIAPGEEVLSTTPDDNYERFAGTSMAAPHVAGALALIKQKRPGLDEVGLEHVLAATATDMHLPGFDEVAGAGFPDVLAATGALPARSATIQRSAHLLPADGETGSRVTLRVRDQNGNGVPGVTGAWTTSMGTLTTNAFTTDGAGEATTTLTIDDAKGAAVVTATPAGLAAQAMRVIVEDDRVRVDDVEVVGEGRGGGDYVFFNGEEPRPEDPIGDGVGGAYRSPLRLEPGEEVRIRIFASRHTYDAEALRTRFTYTVTDPDGQTVDALSGAFEPVRVGGFGWQSSFGSFPVDIPHDAAPGTYTITATAETMLTGETHSFTDTFVVGDERRHVLVVDSAFSLTTETFNYFAPRVEPPPLAARLAAAGYLVDTWQADHIGMPAARDLKRYATVIWLGSWAGLPVRTARDYLRAGGNLLLSGEIYPSEARITGRKSYRRYLHALGPLTSNFPDENQLTYPPSVSGVAGGLFEGETYALDPYDLNHPGEATGIITDEMIVNTDEGAAPLFTWPSGLNDPAVAGLSVDTGAYRVVNVTWPVESLADPAALDDMLGRVIASFNPAPRITSSRVVAFDDGSTFVSIEGENFQPTGKTTVTVGGKPLRNKDVTGRTSIFGRVPRLPVGRYDIVVTNPDGAVARARDALVVRRAPPAVFFIDPTFASNDRDRTIRVSGTTFRPGARVFVAGERVPSRRVSSSRLVVTLPEGFGPLGPATVRVRNRDGKTSALRDALLVRYGFTFDIGPGTSHPAVRHLQRRLRDYGFFPRKADVTAFFGSVTAGAVRRFQRDRDLKVTGVLDARTRRALNDGP